MNALFFQQLLSDSVAVKNSLIILTDNTHNSYKLRLFSLTAPTVHTSIAHYFNAETSINSTTADML